MAQCLKFELVSPERLVRSGDVQEVLVPGSEGDFVVLPNHAPVLTTLKPGVITYKDEEGAEFKVFVRGGFAEVASEGLIILAETAIPMEELDQTRLAQEIKDTQEDVADAKDDATRATAQQVVDHLQQLQAAL
jgi:F-type H+-transporting ATPase subunit epsilon